MSNVIWLWIQKTCDCPWRKLIAECTLYQKKQPDSSLHINQPVFPQMYEIVRLQTDLPAIYTNESILKENLHIRKGGKKKCLLKVDSMLNFQMAPLHITLAFSDGKAVTLPQWIAQHQMRHYVKWHIWISSTLHLETFIWKPGVLSEF